MTDTIFNVAIVGGGPGGKAIMDMIFAEKLSGLRMKLIGVADTDPRAVGLCYARKKGIYTTSNYRNLYKLPDLTMIIELTGRDEVAREIYRGKPDHVRLIDNVAAHLFWDIFQIEEKRISERRRAEKVLAAEKERLAVTLRSIGDGVITTDTDGNIVLMNKVAEDLTGWTQGEGLGEPLGKLFHIINEKTGEEGEEPIGQVLKTGEAISLSGDTALVAKDGTSRTIAYTASPIRDKDDKIIGVVLVFQDISEKKKLEQEVVKAQKLESIGVLAGGIAHDFNNILTSVLGNVTLAKMYSEPGNKIWARLEAAEKATLRARDLTQRLLAFSKGGAPIIKAVSIADLVEDSCTFALSGSTVRCQFSRPDDLWLVEVDEGQISQVINNLAINALQAMPEGGIIQVSCENVTVRSEDALPLKPGKFVMISIKDQGPGIPSEYLDRIFDPYFTTKPKGSGLGLANCYSIVKNHRGRITVESHLGVGTTFRIYLPASGKRLVATSGLEETVPAGQGRILVMDDEELVRDTLGEMLAHIGYGVEFAQEGGEAIEMFTRAREAGQPFDAVITDLTVPGGMGGKEAVRRLMKIDPKVKVIVSSGYSEDMVMAKYREYGFCGIIAKPYKIQELSAVLRQLVIAKDEREPGV